jgi:catechol-2,3-dioxygenase
MTTSEQPSIGIQRLQHVVLQVSDVERSTRFYCDLLGFEVTHRRPNGNTFLRAPGSSNDHDLALFGKQGLRPAQADTAGLVHMAWEVDDIRELARTHELLTAAGVLDHTANHGVSLSVYGRDPDGIRFEILWTVPGGGLGEQNVPLDLEAELARRNISLA